MVPTHLKLAPSIPGLLEATHGEGEVRLTQPPLCRSVNGPRQQRLMLCVNILDASEPALDGAGDDIEEVLGAE